MCSLIYFRTPSGVIVVIVALDDHARTSLQAEKQTTSCFQSVCVLFVMMSTHAAASAPVEHTQHSVVVARYVM